MCSLIRTTFIAALALIFSTTPVFGQYLISLADLDQADGSAILDERRHGFIVDSVIVAFDGKGSIGTVHKGMTNNVVPAFFERPAAEELGSLFEQPSAVGDTGRHVVLKVNSLRIEERMGMSKETAICRLSADVLERVDSGWVLLYQFGTTMAGRGKMDATNSHAQNIARCLDHCLQRASRASAQGELVPRPVMTEISHKPSNTRMADVHGIKDGLARKGIYYTFMDLRDDTPDTTMVIELWESANTTATVRAVEPRGALRKTPAWGISDGERLYVNTGKQFVELKSDGEGLHTYWVPPDAYDQEDFNAQLMFGLVGLALSRAGKDHTPLRFDVDLSTGGLVRPEELATMSGRTGDGAGAGTEQYICFSRYSAADTTLCLYLYGGEEACLRKGQHHVVRLVARKDKVPAEVRRGEVVVASFELDTSVGESQAFLVKLDDDGGVKIDHLGTSMANDVIDKLRPENEVK